MIQLYTNNTQDTNKNGIILDPIECIISPELNGNNELTLIHDIDKEEVYKRLEISGAILKVTTPDFDEDQLYKIYDFEKDSESNTITVYARHVLFDLAKKTVFNVNITGNCEAALNKVLEGTRFTGKSNITIQNVLQYKLRKVLNVIAGDDEDSLINSYKGEIECNNYNLSINSKRGTDRGIRVEFGYNLKDIKEKVNFDDVITRIYPYSGDIVLSGDSPYVNSPLISNYSDVYEDCIEMSDITVKEKIIDADGNTSTSSEDTGFDTIEQARQEMINRCNKLYENGADKPVVNYVIDMVNLKKTTEYKNLGYDVLETIKLGDTVHCYNKKLGIETSARCISYSWDCINNEYLEIQLGQFANSFIDTNSSSLENLYKEIILKEQNILLKVNALDNSTSASIELLKNAITATVEGVGASTSTEWKLGSITNTVVQNGYQSQLRQSPRSVSIAWNKISNYAYIDDSEGLILGNEDDGTYSKIGYNGMLSLFMKGMEHPYHSLIYEGSKTINCSGSDYTEVSISLPSIFNGFNDEDIAVAVAIKKVFKDGTYIPYWFGAYGEIQNGELIINAMSAWRSYSTGKAVYDIDCDYDDIWVTDVNYSRSNFIESIGSPVGGSIIVQYILIA